MLLAHDPVHILDHYYSIVDHYTDGQDESQQCHHVQREPEYEHDAESTDEGYRHRYGRDKRGSPALQGEEYDQNHQQKGFEECSVNMVNGF